ncbi:MAG: dUTP diphosphatase [Bradymonadia bacterium]
MSDTLTLQCRRLPAGADPHPIPLPSAQSAGAAGIDLRAALRAPLTLGPGERVRVPTGWAMALPQGTEGQIRPRSGNAWRMGLTCLNSPGTLDADYRGPVEVLLVNHGDAPITLVRGDRIAQLVVTAVGAVTSVAVETLDATDRGAGGFGHTGRQ